MYPFMDLTRGGIYSIVALASKFDALTHSLAHSFTVGDDDYQSITDIQRRIADLASMATFFDNGG